LPHLCRPLLGEPGERLRVRPGLLALTIRFRLGRIRLWLDDEVKGRACLENAARVAPDDARIQAARAN
jgi:hypothetical protein